MATYKRITNRYLLANPGFNPESGDVFIGCSFAQLEPNTQVFENFNLTFRNCNLTRVLIQTNWVIENCNTSQDSIEQETDLDRRKIIDKLIESCQLLTLGVNNRPSAVKTLLNNYSTLVNFIKAM